MNFYHKRAVSLLRKSIVGVGLTTSILASSMLYAQNTTPTLRLKSGERSYPSNASSFVSQRNNFEGFKFNNHYFMVVQFDKLPTHAEQQQLKTQGIELLKYLPDNSFTAKISNTVSSSTFTKYHIHALVGLSIEQKVEGRLMLGDIPEWAMDGTDVMLVITPFERVGIMQLSSELNRVGATLVHESNVTGDLTIRVPETNVLQLASMPWVIWAEALPEPPKEENYYGKSAHRSSILQYGSRNLDGTGVNIGIWDGGNVDSHLDFTSRVTLVENTSVSDHGTHVAGIMAGAGLLNPRHTGMAPKALIFSHNFNGDIASEMQAAINNHGIVITQNSYGGSASCSTFDPYGSNNRGQDLLVNNNPHLVHVFSAGNSQSSCTGGFGTTTGKAAKNTITVGALTNTDVITTFSSFGPVQDGRIKPEVSSFGNGVISTYLNNGYASNSGTSMAAPGTSGTVAQLYQRYRQLNAGANPIASLVKAILANNADDLGNVGPDYKYGFGRINGLKAAKALEGTNYVVNTVSTGNQNDVTVAVPAGVHEVKVMLCWSDPAALANANPALINNLDLEVIDPSNNTVLPWTLSRNSPNNLAVRGVNNVDIIEQVTIPTPAAGTYTLRVKGTAVPEGPNQQYALTWTVNAPYIEVTYPSAGMTLSPGESELIQWDMEGVTGTTSVEYSLDNGANWTTINAAVAANTRRLTWTVPNAMTNQAKVRVSSGALNNASEAFAIIGTPTGLVAQPCSAQVALSWDAVTNADEYIVYQLNTTTGSYTQVGTSATTSFIVGGLTNNTLYWFAVRAKNTSTGATSQRTVAISATPLASLASDVELVSIVSPSTGCDIRTATEAITIRLKNLSCTPITAGTSIPVEYTVNAGTAISENFVVPTTLVANTTADYTFVSTVDMSGTAPYTLTARVNMAGDGNTANDAITGHVVQNNPPISVLPYLEDFENPNPAECWERINEGTGSFQYGTALGSSSFPIPSGSQYAAANDDACASPGCGAPFKSWLISPKIDLTNYQAVDLRFRGVFRTSASFANIGRVRVSTDRINWTDVHSMASINNTWQNITVDLSAYGGEPQVWVAFYYDDLGNWAYGFAVDDVELVEQPFALVSTNPAHNATNVAINTTLAITFNQPPTLGSGNITLTGGAIPIVIPISSANTSISGNTATVSLPTTLASNTTYSVEVPSGVFTTSSGSAFAGILPANWQFTTALTDSDSRIVAPTVMPTASTISSLATTSASAVEVFSFKVEDLATADALPTNMTQVVINRGANTSVADWRTQLAGAELWRGATQITATTTINAGNIAFTIPSGNASTANGSNTDYILKVFLQNTGITDGATLEFTIPNSGHNAQVGTSSSLFATSFPAAVTSNLFTLNVIATELRLSVPTQAIINASFSATVSATDANGNTDGAARNVTLSRETGVGILSSAGGLAGRALSNGTFTWNDLQFDALGIHSLRADDDGSAMTVVSTNINVVQGSSTPPTPPVTSPTNLRAVATDTTLIQLTWTDALNETGYRLYRNNRLITTLNANSVAYEDTGLQEDTRYSYRLEAFNSVSTANAVTSEVTYPKVPTLVSITDACEGSTGKVIVTSTHNTSVYNWYVSLLSPPLDSYMSVFTTAALTTSTTYFVKAKGIKYESQEHLEVTVNVKPVPTATILGEASRITCESSLTLEATPVENATYVWRYLGEVVARTTEPSFVATIGGTYNLTVVLNGCASSMSSDVSVRLNQTAAASIEQGETASFCTEGTLSAREVEDATYEWTLDGTVVSNERTFVTTQSGTYTLAVTRQTCTRTDQVDVTITNLPSFSVETSALSFCPSESVVLSTQLVEGATYNWFRDDRLWARNASHQVSTNTSGEYTVEVKLNNCSTTSSSATVTRLAVPEVTVEKTENGLALVTEGTIESVEWLRNNEVISTSGTSFTPEQTGYYKVNVVYETGCSTTSNTVFYRIPDPVTGEEGTEEVCCTVVYPNPTNAQVRIQLASKWQKALEITLTDALGRTLNSKTISENEISGEIKMDLSAYSSGAYFITLTSEDEVATFKVVKED